MEIKGRVNYSTIFQHTLFWLAYILFQAMSFNWENTDDLTFKLPHQILTLIIPVTIALTYINLYILMPVFYYPQKYVKYTIAVIILLFAGGLFIRFFTHEFILPWERVNDPVRYHLENKNFWIPVRILRLSIQSIPIVAISMLLKLMRNAFYNEKNLRAMEKEKYSAEMGLLKAQINPHFFFNTLNSLYALTLQGSGQVIKSGASLIIADALYAL